MIINLVTLIYLYHLLPLLCHKLHLVAFDIAFIFYFKDLNAFRIEMIHANRQNRASEKLKNE